MRVVFTGGSSFTGMHFIKELSKKGHEVIALLSSEYNAYEDIRKKRVDVVKNLCTTEFNCPFGSDNFFTALSKYNDIDIFCHHYSFTKDYKSENFNIIKALEKNTLNIKQLMDILNKKRCNKVILTGSIFEKNEGAGSDNLKVFSPYGVSKSLTYEVFNYYCEKEGIKLGKFVIPNPFGPYEEKRFVYYLMNKWFNDDEAVINCPYYIRDNIPVDLLAKSYLWFLEEFYRNDNFKKFNPGCYAESNINFANRIAKEVKKRIDLKCKLKITKAPDYTEPIVRINTDNVYFKFNDWNEKKSWDGLIGYYEKVFEGK